MMVILAPIATESSDLFRILRLWDMDDLLPLFPAQPVTRSGLLVVIRVLGTPLNSPEGDLWLAGNLA